MNATYIVTDEYEDLRNGSRHWFERYNKVQEQYDNMAKRLTGNWIVRFLIKVGLIKL